MFSVQVCLVITRTNSPVRWQNELSTVCSKFVYSKIKLLLITVICKKHGLQCVTACGGCRGELCSNKEAEPERDSDSEDEDVRNKFDIRTGQFTVIIY